MWCLRRYVRTKLRSNQSFHLKVLTKDSVTVSVDAVVYYRVSNATISVANVENAHHSTRKDLITSIDSCTLVYFKVIGTNYSKEHSWNQKLA